MTRGVSHRQAGDYGWNTIGAALHIGFPDGTEDDRFKPVPTDAHDPFRSHRSVPAFATDLFAFAAYLIERGGVYHRIVRQLPGSGTMAGQNLTLEQDEIDAWESLGNRWRDELAATPLIPNQKLQVRDAVQKKWDELLRFVGEPVVYPPLPGGPTSPPQWWGPAYALLVISDQAARGLGYDDQQLHPIESFRREVWLEGGGSTVPIDPKFPFHVRAKKISATFALRANADIVRVVPKSRTPKVGNTMRTLTHHLALVPPEGVVDMAWQHELQPYRKKFDPLNLLLVPFPFRISAQCFAQASEITRERGESDQWLCMFDVRQRWLTREDGSANSREVVNFLCALIDQAQRDVDRVHGLLLPELSLDWLTYDILVRKLISDCNGKKSDRAVPDFIVCGSSSDWGRDKGNYVLVTTFDKNDKGKLVATTHSRPKHHRWRLTGPQIADYGLSASLDPHVVWWEATQIPNREVGLTVFRHFCVFSAMICEDLARSEPCHEPLKAVGPNLVFALLMDGSQLPDRWSARYATSLADDPGSSVLTLTSLGLIERTNASGAYKESRNIGLWKDDTGKTIPIACPRDAQGVLLTLGGEVAKERTLDGRLNEDTASWRYQGHQPMTLRRHEREKFDRIIEGQSTSLPRSGTTSPPGRASKGRKPTKSGGRPLKGFKSRVSLS